jgi:hypothetical protein
MMIHTLDPQLLERPIRILVVGCGGNGSAIVSGLPYLHQAMLACGHPDGLQVTLVDPDTVSETNCVRQPFCRTEIGFPKAIVLAHRINLFWGLNWQGMQAQIQQVAKNAVLKLKTSEFKILTRSHTPDSSPSSCEELTDIALKLRERVDLGPQQRYRLAGVGLSNFQEPENTTAVQPILFE